MREVNPVDNLIAWALTTLGSAFLGSYLASYLKKKGENLATHEDLGKLVKQMEAVTTATKEIEAKISDQVWNRQRQWELRRDALLAAAKALGGCHQAITDLAVAYKVGGDNPGLMQNQIDRQSQWNAVQTEFATSTRLLVNLVAGKECRRAFSEFGSLTSDIVRKMVAGDVDAFKKSEKEFRTSYIAACSALRKELGVDAEELDFDEETVARRITPRNG